MRDQFTEHLNEHFSFLLNTPFLIACSGGVDSVVLVDLCAKLGLDFALAHCNFKLRKEESDGDESFVRELANSYGKAIFVKQFDTEDYISSHRGSVQMAARTLRYEWFTELLGSKNYDYLLTAHHLDDALETFLINLSRGTGIDGLKGIPAQNERIIRPLLPFSQEVIMAYANEHGISWREDSSNKESKYLRNAIRMDISPNLKSLHPNFLQNFQTTQQNLQQSQKLVQKYIDGLKTDLVKPKNDFLYVEIEELLMLDPLESHLYEIFKPYGFTDANSIKELLTSGSGKELHSKTHRLLKDRNALLIKERELGMPMSYEISKQIVEIDEPVAIRFELTSKIGNSNNNTIYVDKEKLNYPLLLRNWEKGDYFYPLGMTGKKKLSKYFKDEKVDQFSKENQWLLCTKDAVVWVVGRRMDNRFKVTESTKEILKITLLT